MDVSGKIGIVLAALRIPLPLAAEALARSYLKKLADYRLLVFFIIHKLKKVNFLRFELQKKA